MTKARENSDYTGLAADIVAGDTAARAGRKNLILNGSMQISQRGDYTSSVTFSSTNYYHDRWISTSGASANLQELSVNQPNSVGKSVRVTTTNSVTAQCTLEQRIELPEWLTSRTVTMSAWVKSNSSNCALNIYHGVDGFATPVSHTGGGAWEKLEMVYTLSGSSTSDFRTRIGLSQGGGTTITSGDYFEFTEVQLELGSVATDFEHRSYGEELALCQRYYEKVGFWVQGWASAASQWAGCTLNFAVTKRNASYTLTLNTTAKTNNVTVYVTTNVSENATGVQLESAAANSEMYGYGFIAVDNEL